MQEKDMWREGELWRKARGLVLKETPYTYGSRQKSSSIERVDKALRIQINDCPYNFVDDQLSPGSRFQTDPGQDQGGILREKKRLSPKKNSLGRMSSGNASPPQEDTESKTVSTSRPRSDLVVMTPIKNQPKIDPRQESPRNAAHAAPIRQRKKNVTGADFPFLVQKSNISDLNINLAANLKNPNHPMSNQNMKSLCE
jgi:hypothetical protein